MFKKYPALQASYDAQEQLAKDNQAEAEKLVAEYQRQLEEDYDYPIRDERLHANAGAPGAVRSVWSQAKACQHHSIDLEPREAWLMPAMRAHELRHIELECEAAKHGVRKTDAALIYPSDLRQLGLSREEFEKLFSYSMNVPLDLLVDAWLFQRFPRLRPAMFVNACRFQKRNCSYELPAAGCSAGNRTALNALRAASALFTDETYGRVTGFFAPFRGTPDGDLAEKLYAAFQQSFPLSKPDGHYELVNRFGEIIGFPNLHAWDSRPRWELVAAAARLAAVLGQERERPDFRVVPATTLSGRGYAAIIKQVIQEKYPRTGGAGSGLQFEDDYSITAKIPLAAS